jgi:hypothetical protein
VPFSSPQYCCPPRAHDGVNPAPFLSPQHRRPRAVPGPATPSSSPSTWHHRPHNVLVLTMPSAPHHPWVRNDVVLPEPATLQCIFFYVILGLQILNLICYIATLLWYATLLLFCCIALICYIVTLLWYAILPHYFDMLYYHIALICYTLLHCFCSTIFWSIWMHTILLNDESRLSEMSVAIWINIICTIKISALNNM